MCCSPACTCPISISSEPLPVADQPSHAGRKLRLITLIDEFTRECLAIRVARRINSFGVLETMADVMLIRGVPEYIRSDKALR